MTKTQPKKIGAALGLLGALSGALTGVAFAAPAAPAVYGESATVKIRPHTEAKPNAGLTLAGARNEFVSFQVVVAGGEAGAKGVQAKFADLSGPSTLGGEDITLYREALLNIQKASTPDAQGMWPDGLVPDVDPIAHEQRNAFPFDVPANEARAIWVDVHIPQSAEPGTYQGQVEVTGEGLSETVPVSLQVLPATLPSTSSLPSAFLIFSGNVCLAHLGSTDCGTPEARDQLLSEYARVALDHRITLSNLSPMGKDWTAYDALMTPLMEGTAPTRLEGAKMTSLQFTGKREADVYAAFEDHLKSNGWLERAYDYTGDEPPYGTPFNTIQERQALVKANAPDLARLVTTTVQGATDNGLLEGIDTMTPVINQMDGTVAPYQGDQRSSYDDFLSQPGKKLWLYQSCMSHGCAYGTNAEGSVESAGWPSYAVDAPASRNRAMQWEVFLENASGELYYETANMLPSAWSDQFSFGGNGDGTLFYPGNTSRIGGQTAIPLPSIRLKLLREGMQDYEWLKLVSDAGDPAFAQQVARTLLPSASQVPADGAAFDDARAQLEQRYVELTGGDASSVPLSPSGNSSGLSAGAAAQGEGCGSSGPGAPAAAMGLMLPLWLFRRRRG